MPASRAPHPDTTLFTAWILLLLAEREHYGWALAGALRERGISVAAGLTYRRLQELERDGALVSRWAKSEVGPSRRWYRLTEAGRGNLEERAAIIERVYQCHEAFARAHEHRPAADGEPADARGPERAGAARGGADAAAASRPGRELLAAWLLLLLERGASYGYELRREIDARAIRADPATLYRILRQLEGAGWLESRWMSPSAGPRRRFYRVTGSGRRNLDELAVVITRIRDTHASFLSAYAGAPGGASAHSASE